MTTRGRAYFSHGWGNNHLVVLSSKSVVSKLWSKILEQTSRQFSMRFATGSVLLKKCIHIHIYIYIMTYTNKPIHIHKAHTHTYIYKYMYTCTYQPNLYYLFFDARMPPNKKLQVPQNLPSTQGLHGRPCGMSFQPCGVWMYGHHGNGAVQGSMGKSSVKVRW